GAYRDKAWTIFGSCFEPSLNSSKDSLLSWFCNVCSKIRSTLARGSSSSSSFSWLPWEQRSISYIASTMLYISSRVMKPSLSTSGVGVTAHSNFSSTLPLDVTESARMNSSNSMEPS
ncbi:unnamed protein product, partial [Ixodes pacificus]